jgi:flagellar hook-associated protein 2
MGAVGINFGSATSGAGFDVATTVDSIVANLQQVETPWKNQLTALKADDAALTSIGSDLASLSSSLNALTDFQGVMAGKAGSSSDPNVLALTSANPTASAGSHTIVVSQLAQTASEYSDAISPADRISGALTIQVGTGPATTISVVGGSSDTLATFAGAINYADVGVTASIISDASGTRLSLVSKTSGAAGALTVTQGGTVGGATYSALADVTVPASSLAINVGLSAQNAKLTVDGIAIDSASNTVSTAIPGVTFQILSKSTAPVQVQITNDNTDVETAVSNFVAAYNTVLGDLKTQEGKDASGNPEPLYGDPIISQLQSALSLALTSGSANGTVKSLYQLGISVNNSGTLTLDTSALESALNSNYAGMVGFLQDSKSFGQMLANALDQLGNSSPTGAISLALAANSAQETTYNNDIAAEDALIATQKAALTLELNSANQILQAIPDQLNEVNILYSAMTGYNTRTG